MASVFGLLKNATQLFLVSYNYSSLCSNILWILGAMKRIENATNIAAISHERSQINMKFSVKPIFTATKVNVTKLVVIMLIVTANFNLNLRSFILRFFNYKSTT